MYRLIRMRSDDNKFVLCQRQHSQSLHERPLPNDDCSSIVYSMGWTGVDKNTIKELNFESPDIEYSVGCRLYAYGKAELTSEQTSEIIKASSKLLDEMNPAFQALKTKLLGVAVVKSKVADGAKQVSLMLDVMVITIGLGANVVGLPQLIELLKGCNVRFCFSGFTPTNDIHY